MWLWFWPPSARGVSPTALLLTWFSPNRLYLGNPMDPPDLLSVELSTSRPTQHLGRVKSKSPPVPWCSHFTGYLEKVTALKPPRACSSTLRTVGPEQQVGQLDSWLWPGVGWGRRREAAVSAEVGILGLVYIGPAASASSSLLHQAVQILAPLLALIMLLS